MSVQTQSYEWFDAISRQGSRLSRASFQTARTEYSICEEIDEFKNNFINEVNEIENKFKTRYNSRKSVTFKLPEIETHLEQFNTKDKTDLQKVRSKTTPFKNCSLNIREQPTREEGILIGSSLEEKMRRERKDTFKDTEFKPLNTDSIHIEDINLIGFQRKQILNDQISNFGENIGSIETNGFKIDHIKKKSFTSSFFSIKTFLHKENIQSTESNEFDLRNLIKKKSGSKFFTSPLQQIKYIYNGLSLNKRNSEITEILIKNDNRQISDKPYIEPDLPFVHIEDENEFHIERNFFKKTIFSYLNCNKVCCLSL